MTLDTDSLIVGRYRIVRQVGRGGMGAVYEAVDERLRALVALKQMAASAPGAAQAFEREAQILAGLRLVVGDTTDGTVGTYELEITSPQ